MREVVEVMEGEEFIRRNPATSEANKVAAMQAMRTKKQVRVHYQRVLGRSYPIQVEVLE